MTDPSADPDTMHTKITPADGRQTDSAGPDTDSEPNTDTNRIVRSPVVHLPTGPSLARVAVLTLVGLVLAAAVPAAAQTGVSGSVVSEPTTDSVLAPTPTPQDGGASGSGNTICESDTGLVEAITGLMMILESLGLAGAVVMWKWQSVVQIVTPDPKDQERLQQKKNQIKRGVLGLLAVGPLYVLGGSVMGLPIATCIASSVGF